MYLKSLTMLGFKSFAEKTTLNFQPGITAIVGPNGCGKSNVADAVRWVLGEQSAKALRGGEMADVIFNGAERRKATGMAEVSLCIGDIDAEHLKTAGVELEFNEVTLTRRVFRDGASEYFINKTPCRLKDIQQLFMGTGVGRASYSIMAQGNITQIISSKPEDRRMVFEEAAGITKFKAQKKEALRKLEQTEQNLLRVSDLIREVKRQIGSLQRQAGKARRFKQLKADLQHLETQLARHQWDECRAQIQQLRQTLDQRQAESDSRAAGIAQKENEIAQLRAALSEIEEQIRRLEQRGHERRNQIERDEGRIQFNQERLRELESQNQAAWREIAQGEERLGAAEEELRILRTAIEHSTVKSAEMRQTLRDRQAAVQAVENNLRTQQESSRQVQAGAFAQAQQLSRLRNQLNALDVQKQGNTVRLEKLASERIELEEESSRLAARLREFTDGVEQAQIAIENCRGAAAERQGRLREVERELSSVAEGLDQRLRQQAELRSRLAVLEQLDAGHEGFSSGTLAALKESPQAIGSLADQIRVADPYVPAVETALGHHLQLVLTDQPETAHQILAELQAQKKGRASLAALSFWKNGAAHASELEVERSRVEFSTPADARPIRMLDVIQCQPQIAPLVRRLLKETWIVRNLAEATQLWQERPGQASFVTAAGELLDLNGIFTGGAGNGNGQEKSPVSLLGRKNQIAELRETLSRIQEEVNEASRRKGALQSEATALQASLSQAQSALRSEEVAIAARQAELKVLRNSESLLKQKIETAAFEAEGLARQENEGNERRADLARQIAEAEALEQATQQTIAQSGVRLEELRRQRDAASQKVTEIKVELAGQEQMRASQLEQARSLEKRTAELKQLLEQKKEETSAYIAKRSQCEREIEQARGRLEALRRDREQLNAELAGQAALKENQDAEIAAREDFLRQERRELAELQNARSALEVQIAQKEMSAQNLVDRVFEKYQIRLEDVPSECITITIVSEGPPKIEALTPEEMSAHGLATDWAAVAEQVNALQKRLDEMGPVNLVAIEEYEEAEQRSHFLSEQNDDLLKAKEQLLEVISKINAQTKEMFADTFQKIRQNFQALFAEIFGGGKADLLLADEGEILESGIEIVARPPGKQLQSISLLSGGEQTMTAVALLFSIYQVKPSPFCLLDELDAPLDESNINRFIRIVQRFLLRSQFVIITHNKRTIGMADILYGITMEEQGVSKIVSVRFHKTSEAANDSAPAANGNPLVPPAPVSPVEAEEDKPQKPADALEVALAG